MAVDDLFEEAERQLNICNACRYCEGYCAVFPALEMRTALTSGDITHLANLCHDCRACYSACMYTAPHAFDLDPPLILTEVRQRSYGDYVRGLGPGALKRNRVVRAVAGTFVLALLLAGLVVLSGGTFEQSEGAASPYEVLAHELMLIVGLAPALWAIAVALIAARRYWRDTHGPVRDLLSAGAWASALRRAGELRYMRGGGEECQYPDERPTPTRRRLHAFAAYGLLLCFLSTTSAAIQQNLLGSHPPYPLLSVPAMLGTLGGIGLVIGCAGLMWLKPRSVQARTTGKMLNADYGLLVALLALALTGLLTRGLRATPAYGPLVVVHLATVVTCIALVPYTKFMHLVYRLLAIYKHGLDQRRVESR